jgi:hypothetical protein
MAAHKSLDVLIHYFDQNKNPKKKREERRRAKRARSLVDVDVIRIYPMSYMHFNSHCTSVLQCKSNESRHKQM